MIDSLSGKNVENPAIENFCNFMKKIGRFLEEEKIPAILVYLNSQQNRCLFRGLGFICPYHCFYPLPAHLPRRLASISQLSAPASVGVEIYTHLLA
jgi:hypothetical protein